MGEDGRQMSIGHWDVCTLLSTQRNTGGAVRVWCFFRIIFGSCAFSKEVVGVFVCLGSGGGRTKRRRRVSIVDVLKKKEATIS